MCRESVQISTHKFCYINDMKIKELLPILALLTTASHLQITHAQSFWDIEVGGFKDNNWNRAAQNRFKAEDTIYQYSARYGYSQEINPRTGIIYGLGLSYHDWRKYSLLDNTRLHTSVEYQHRLRDALNSPWLFIGANADYHRYEDRKRRASVSDIYTGLGQNFSQWNYQLTLGRKVHQAKQTTFDKKANYAVLNFKYTPSNALFMGVEFGYEKGDVSSSTVTSQRPTYYIAQTHDDAFRYENRYAYRLKAKTHWSQVSAGYGWYGKHEVSASFQHYDSSSNTRDYDGEKLQLQYTRLF